MSRELGTIRELERDRDVFARLMREAHDGIVRWAGNPAAECWCIYCKRAREVIAAGRAREEEARS